MQTTAVPNVALGERSSAATPGRADWRAATRLLFRLVATYFTLYVVATQMARAMVPFWNFTPLDQTEGVVRSATTWVATQVLGFAAPISYRDSGSGDRAYDWAFCVLLLLSAAALTAVWSVLNRRRPNYVTLHAWFRLFLRFALGATLASYGVSKLVPIQMPYPNLTTLLQPFGQLTLRHFCGSKSGPNPPTRCLPAVSSAAVSCWCRD